YPPCQPEQLRLIDYAPSAPPYCDHWANRDCNIDEVTMVHATDQPECWPALPLDSWKETYATLHMWTQIVGKVRLRLTPLVNHWWNVPLYVSARGLTTTPMTNEDRIFEMEFDFLDHKLRIECSDDALKTIPLRPQSVADFYQEVMTAL